MCLAWNLMLLSFRGEKAVDPSVTLIFLIQQRQNLPWASAPIWIQPTFILHRGEKMQQEHSYFLFPGLVTSTSQSANRERLWPCITLKIIDCSILNHRLTCKVKTKGYYWSLHSTGMMRDTAQDDKSVSVCFHAEARTVFLFLWRVIIFFLLKVLVHNEVSTSHLIPGCLLLPFRCPLDTTDVAEMH